MHTIGIDISKRWFDGYCLQRQQNRRFSNNLIGWNQFLRWIPGGAHIVMEASGPYYLNLASWLCERQVTVSVVNPLVIRRYSQMKLTRTKTDAKDARLIACYGAEQQPEPWTPPSKVRQALKQLMSLRDALLRQRAVGNGQKEAFGQQHVEPLVGEVLAEQQDQIDRQLARIDKRMEVLATQHYSQQLQALLTIPGVGKKTAIHLLTITDGFRRFDSPRKLASYVGICPRIWESGSSVKGRGSISKLGCPQLRKLLYMCSWSAKRSNPACREMYNRLKKKGKPEKVIKVAIAHKLLRQAYAVGSKYEPFTKENALAA